MGLDVARMNAGTCLVLLILILFVSLMMITISIATWQLDPYIMWDSLQGGGLFFAIVLIIVALIGYVFFTRRLTPTYYENLKLIENLSVIIITGLFGILILPWIIATGAKASAERNDPGTGDVVFLVVWTLTFLFAVILLRWRMKHFLLHGD